MKKFSKELEFISLIKRDGSGTEQIPKKMLENIYDKNNEFEINPLSLSSKTYIASGFNSFVVRLK